MTRFHHAYLHGFASSPLATKGLALAERLAEHQVELLRPDLNAPSFEAQTFTNALGVLDQMDAASSGALWRLVGSSMGGYLAARWAELNPTRVDRLVLLCPGFHMLERWPEIFGAQAFTRWEREGTLMVPDGAGVPRALRWDLIVDAARHPETPEVPCPTLIIHGTRDETVPIDSSRRYASTRPHVSLLELDADHRLLGAQDEVFAATIEFLRASATEPPA